MGTYLNPSSISFQESINSEIYIDKSELIAFVNKKVNTKQKNICVSRPRRFGKTMAADMLAAYYNCGENTDALFDGLKIKNDRTYSKYLNRFDVVKVDMQFFLSSSKSVSEMLKLLTDTLVEEIKMAYPDVTYMDESFLSMVFDGVFQRKNKQFVVIIDEWECVMRRIPDLKEQKEYLDYLRNWLKDRPYIALVYMTGILPIKKYGEHSTLNMFDEYSMTQSHKLVPYFGFTEEEVKELCVRYDMDFDEAKEWYDGYHFDIGREGKPIPISMYSPRSVVSSMLNERFDTYWTQTESYEALKVYIRMNYDGLRDAIVGMLAGTSVRINTRHFQNDMNTFNGKDDVLTLLVHLGYLSYDDANQTVSIPNKEVAREFVASIENVDTFSEVFTSIEASRELLNALWNYDNDTVAKGIEKAHQQFPSIKYNNENALSCVIELAFYYAREYYTVIREFPTGKGFADICFLPKPRYANKPAVIVELKWDKSVTTAIDQIKRKDYPDALKAYHGNLLLCGINYDKDNPVADKRHACHIESYEIT